MKQLLVMSLLITCTTSQRRWAGSYPTESPPLEASTANGNDKHGNVQRGQQRPEDPYYAANRRDDSITGGDKPERIQPENIEARRHQERKNPPPVVKDEIPARNDRGSIVTITKVENRDNRELISTSHANRNDNPLTGGRVVVISQTVPKQESDFDNPKRRDEVPISDGRFSVAQRTKRPASIDTSTRTYHDSRKNYYPSLESRDDRLFVTTQNSYYKQSTVRSGDSDHQTGRNNGNPIRNNDKVEGESTRFYPRNFGYNRDSKDRAEEKPKFHLTTRSHGFSPPSVLQTGIRKVDGSNPDESRKTESEHGRRYDLSDHKSVKYDTTDPCPPEEGPKIPINNGPPSRNPIRIDPPKNPKLIPEISRKEAAPSITTGIKDNDRKFVVDYKSDGDKAGYNPDISYDAILFPKDDDYERYEVEPTRTHRKRKKRGIDLHEDVEILPGYGTKQETAIKHDDVVLEEEVEIFSPVEIRYQKSR